MSGSPVRVVASTLLFAVVHSALASRTAKQGAARLVGTRNRNGLYRAFYVTQSIATSAALVATIRHARDKTLYEVPRPYAYGLRLAQGICLGISWWGARRVGIARISGLENLRAWSRGDTPAPEPAAQGPSLTPNGQLDVGGPFRWSRHPLNFWPLQVLLLNPCMTINWLTCGLTSIVYLALGSMHEEFRLREVYGEQYKRYQQSDVPFYLPRRRRASTDQLRVLTPANSVHPTQKT